jgi:hypothetical protein
MLLLCLFLDTNIVVSAALKAEGLQRTVLLMALTRPAVERIRADSFRVKVGFVASRAENRQKPAATVSAMDRECLAYRTAIAPNPCHRRSGRQHFPGVRRCRPRRLPCDRKPAPFSEILEANENRNFTRIHCPGRSLSCPLSWPIPDAKLKKAHSPIKSNCESIFLNWG